MSVELILIVGFCVVVACIVVVKRTIEANFKEVINHLIEIDKNTFGTFNIKLAESMHANGKEKGKGE